MCSQAPVDLSPNKVLAGGTDTDDGSHCDCGWPYTLFLRRGTTARDAAPAAPYVQRRRDREVGAPGDCGSMSFCGRRPLPDGREMGYLFNRPFKRPTNTTDATAITKTFEPPANAAGRTITIRHTN